MQVRMDKMVLERVLNGWKGMMDNENERSEFRVEQSEKRCQGLIPTLGRISLSAWTNHFDESGMKSFSNADHQMSIV